MKIAVHFSIGKTQQIQLRNTILHVTEAETKTNYCETETVIETETETKKVVSRSRWSRDLNITKFWNPKTVLLILYFVRSLLS